MRLVIVLTTAAMALACATAVAAGRPSVVGHVYIPGGPKPRNAQARKPHPAVNALVDVFARHHFVAHTRVLANGSFTFRLAPGRYRLVVSLTPPRFKRGKLCESRQVTVRKNHTLRLMMECVLL